MPSTSEIRVSVSKDRVPWPLLLYLWKVETAGHPSSARCSPTLKLPDRRYLEERPQRRTGHAAPDSRVRTQVGATAGRGPCAVGSARVSIYGYHTPYLNSPCESHSMAQNWLEGPMRLFVVAATALAGVALIAAPVDVSPSPAPASGDARVPGTGSRLGPGPRWSRP